MKMPDTGMEDSGCNCGIEDLGCRCGIEHLGGTWRLRIQM